jgi:hypothetical protein
MAKWDHEDLKSRIEPSFETRAMPVGTPTGNMIPASLIYTPQPESSIDHPVDPFHPGEGYFVEGPMTPTLKNSITYRYSEGKNMDEFRKYVDSTYSAHYTTKNEIQALDVFEALGSLFTTSRDLAIKYLWRAGKKGTKEDLRKDLLKVMHYCLFMLHAMDTEKK